MVHLPAREDYVAEAIYAAYERKAKAAPRRPHLGASLIGDPCERKLWLTFRWAAHEQHTGRLLRLFDTGAREESRIEEELKAIGCEVYMVDPSTGRQFHYSDHGGHFAGSQDGAVLGVPKAEKTWHVLECKTHNAKSFAELKKQGVQSAKPQHYAQMVVYMGWAVLTRALYFAVNKDADEVYTERVPENPGLFRELRSKALRVITADTPPAATESYCAFCGCREVCNGALPLVHCRTCLHAVPITEGTGARWQCRKKGQEVPTLLQERGCEHHLFIPAMVTFGREVERGDGFVVYEHAKRLGEYFVNSTPPAFPSVSGECYPSADMGSAQ